MKKLLLLVTAACAINATADEIPLGYYSSLTGKCGAELKTAIHKLVSQNVSMLSYGSGDQHTWWGFYVTDYMMDGSGRQVIDRYSNGVCYFSSRGSSVTGMNIEHSFPKSWWGGEQNNAYKDLFNLMPCEQKINSSKSNYGMGVVTSTTANNGCTKVGTGSDGTYLWEPADKWKGDFARGYMYMATAYQDYEWKSRGLNLLENTEWPTLKEWAYKLYMQWGKQDPVSDIEITRNNSVSSIQGNRNPYVDFPNLPEYVWGDSIAVPFNPLTTVKSAASNNGDGGLGTGGGNDTGDATTSIYNANYKGNTGDCTTSGTSDVWENTTSYGWKGSAFKNNQAAAADATLTTPEIDLTGYESATLSFMHTANKFNSGAPADFFTVSIIVDGAATQELSGFTWPKGTNWTFVSSGDIDLTAYVGHKVKFAFRYTSTDKSAGTWEISSVKVTGKATAGVNNIIVDTDSDTKAPIEYYSIDGRRLNPETARGIVIRRQGNKATKLHLR